MISLPKLIPFLLLVPCIEISPLLAKQDANEAETLRVATFNVSLNRRQSGELIQELKEGSEQAKVIAEIIQRIAPDILLLNEFDFDEHEEAIALFQGDYLEQEMSADVDPIRYEYRFVRPVNTGVPSGFNLDNDENGVTDAPGDAIGYGAFPGQYGMVVLSRFPIDVDSSRTFQELLWKQMPNALLPDDSGTTETADYYSQEELDVLRLSSKSHWDVVIQTPGGDLHFLVCHPTPPAFDGPEDRNGKRNHDEIRLWSDYISGGERASYIVDDRGRAGGLAAQQRFVIAGDLNADPADGDSASNAILQLLNHERVAAQPIPSSNGGSQQSSLQGGANVAQQGEPRFDTADFNDNGPGNLRVDYVIPSRWGIKVVDAQVFWPAQDDPLFDLIGTYPFPSSDHRPVYLDIQVSD